MRGCRSTSTQPPPYPNRYRAPARNAGCPTGRRREPTHSRAVFARESNRATMHASSAVRRPRSAGAPHVPLTALRGPPSGAPARPAGILGTVPTQAAGIRRMVPARSAGIRRLSLPHPEEPPSIPCPAPIEPPPVSALEGMTGARGPIPHVNQIKLAGRFSA